MIAIGGGDPLQHAQLTLEEMARRIKTQFGEDVSERTVERHLDRKLVTRKVWG